MKRPTAKMFSAGLLAITVLWAASCSPNRATPPMSPQFVAQGRDVLAAIERCDRSHRGPFIAYDPLLRNARQSLENLHAGNDAERTARQALMDYLSAIEFVRRDWERFDQTARAKILRDETARAQAETDAARDF